MATNIWKNQGLLDRLDQERDKKRDKRGRLTYDCFNLMCRGSRAHCSKGKMLRRSKDGSLELIYVLKGFNSGTCKNCKEFRTEEEL